MLSSESYTGLKEVLEVRIYPDYTNKETFLNTSSPEKFSGRVLEITALTDLLL